LGFGCFPLTFNLNYTDMIIFIKDIPPETNKDDIADFIKSSSVQIKVEDIIIFSSDGDPARPDGQHGLVWVSPSEAGERAIKRLNGLAINGVDVTVREYVNRSADNDPRSKSPGMAIAFKDRRLGDRRRKSLVVPWPQ
jgi:RNA recognition motif-containing protein